jgi:pyruvate formate lyase activating enzyme
MESAVITNIQGYSIHDGPGIRTVVFFKGCPLSCKWCQNPECILANPQIGFIELLCKGCGKCLKVCPNNAISIDKEKHRIDYSLCNSCGICSENCMYGALVKYGKLMTVDEVWDEVRRDKIFYNTSNGGVTVSGGEPLLHAAFVRQLFELCHGEGINTCIETCGNVSLAAFQEVMPVTDHFLFDLKHMDADIHKVNTGNTNNRILENAAFLVQHHVDIIFRNPLIPGINDTESNIDATAEFLRGLNGNALRLELMPFHRMGKDKYRALDMEYLMGETGIMKMEEIEMVKRAYNDRGINCTISR